MANNTPGFDNFDYDKPQRGARKSALKSANGNAKRYMTAAVVLGGGALIAGPALASYASSRSSAPGGIPITQGGQNYYLANDSRRAIYPSKEACLQDVPWDRQAECEPATNYQTGGGSGSSGGHGGWYGPVYTPRDSYQPRTGIQSEPASASNTGKGSSVPKGASSSGFGSSGKGSAGGESAGS